MAAVILPDAPWRHMAGIGLVQHALGAEEGLTRFVGGAVRDTLTGLDVKDVDLATRLSPQEVMERLSQAKVKVVPTGLAHGTVTAVVSGGSVEITTLRRDVSTDGRRATVAFTDDWREDAARRDFTINALYADPNTGEVFDYFGGSDDLAAGRVRFIGEPLQRIAEDHLRTLRFFRFHARFGKGAPDSDGLAACAARANDLMALSRERIAQEMLALLALPDPVDTVALMLAHEILMPVLPEIVDAGPLRALVKAEATACVEASPLRRFAALLPADPARAAAIAHRLKLSKAANKRLSLSAGRGVEDSANPKALAYRLGTEAAVDRLLLLGAPQAAAVIADWPIPAFPLTGGAIVARGVKAGPEVARVLKVIEAQWVAEGFPNGERAVELLSVYIPG
jgi:poly(A) polymerase